MSASYEFYQNTYCGDILSAEDFPRYVVKADNYLGRITRDMVAPYLADDVSELDEDIVKKVYMAECELAEQYQTIQESKKSVLTAYSETGGFLASETVGAHSQSFRSGYDVAKEAESGLYSIAAQYLAWTGLMYRGIPCTRHT